MKVGELYEVRHKWLLPKSRANFWEDCGAVLYLGEDVIEWIDGTKIVNHAVICQRYAGHSGSVDAEVFGACRCKLKIRYSFSGWCSSGSRSSGW